MTLTVDKCPNFDNFKCSKCGRTMPDYCLDQEELERKARAYDDMLKEKEAVVKQVEPVVVKTKGRPKKETPVEQTPPSD